MRSMSTSAFITCAVTGSGDSTGSSDKVPVTPEQIAESALEAAKAGAAVVHIHVRNPQTGKGARDVAYYREVVERVRASGTDVVVNLTTGMGGDLVLGGAEEPLPYSAAGTDMAGATERLAHVAELRPEICSLDCGTMNFAAGGDYIMVNAPSMVRAMAQGIKDLGVKPEVEVFDTGDLVLLNQLVDEGLIDGPALVQLCMGIPYGAPNDPLTLAADGRPAAARTRCSRRSRSAASSSRTQRWRCCSAGTCASGWRTTSTCPAACWPPTGSWSSAPSPCSRR